MTFWTLWALKCPLENYSKPYGRATAMPPGGFNLRPEVEAGDILELVGCKIFPRKFALSLRNSDSLPTA